MEKEVHAETSEEIAYAFRVHGNVPEFMPRFAFRREKHFKTAGKKIIKCPYCQRTFITVDTKERIELYPHSRDARIVYDEAIACGTCHRLVGIIYTDERPA
jgi:transposase-like protein